MIQSLCVAVVVGCLSARSLSGSPTWSQTHPGATWESHRHRSYDPARLPVQYKQVISYLWWIDKWEKDNRNRYLMLLHWTTIYWLYSTRVTTSQNIWYFFTIVTQKLKSLNPNLKQHTQANSLPLTLRGSTVVMTVASMKGLGLLAVSSMRLCHWRGSPTNFCSCSSKSVWTRCSKLEGAEIWTRCFFFLLNMVAAEHQT